MLDMCIAVELVGIFMGRIAAIVLRLRAVIDMLVVESCTAREIIKRKRLIVVAVNAGIQTVEILVVPILYGIIRIPLATVRTEGYICQPLRN